MNKKELKQKIEELPITHINNISIDRHERRVKIGSVLELIEQLDESETLSKEWVDAHLTDGHNVDAGEKVVFVVPKQEKPVIPQFVAGWIEKCKSEEKKYNLYGVFQYAPKNIDQWLFNTMEKSDRVEMITRAWLDGYEVEKEKEYQLRWKTNPKLYLFKDGRTGEFHLTSYVELTATKGIFTEYELEDIDETGFERVEVSE